MTARHSPADLAAALGLHRPTDEQAAVIAAPPGPLVVIAGAGAGKTETMAARVVWLVANGHAHPAEVLGLTFTRKAAGQLLRRVRSRLAALAAAGLLDDPDPTGSPTVATYHAFAGQLLREHGLLLGVEPHTRLLGETERWQLAYDVVTGHPGELPTRRTPETVTRLVLRLCDQLAEHLVDTADLRDTHRELEQLIHTLPPGPRQRAEPNQQLRGLLAAQNERSDLVPLIDAVHRRMRAEAVMDFGTQMATAARLAERFPQIGAELRRTYRVVLLDEYQDTGHAQRVALSALFGGGADGALALTAVGDPIQSIYGWRGASATNLPRFTTDFPLPDGSPAPTRELRTSWRNPPATLAVANAVSAQARERSVEVHELRPAPHAAPGTVTVALLDDVTAERDWVAEQLQRRYARARQAGEDPPTAAVLVRRNADAAPMADALRARGVPAEVAGLAGLLTIPEVADLVAMLRLVADPTAGSATLRVLTGARWRLGAADLAALWRRARRLADPPAPSADPAQIAAAAGPDTDNACLADAVTDPGPATDYSAAGYRRLLALAEELTVLRAQLHHPLPDVVAELRRVLGSDTEVRAAQPPGTGGGTEQLDAFADVVARYAEHTGPRTGTVAGLLGYLDAAVVAENGLAPAEPAAAAAHRVQVLTVHAAKGLEWQVVAVPHLVSGVFPSTASASTWLTDPGDLPPLLRGDRASLSAHGVPVLDTDGVTHRKQLSDVIDGHRRQLAQRRSDEERRLLYVAVTRAEDTLLLSGHHWAETGRSPRGPAEFLTEIKDLIDSTDDLPGAVTVDQWAPEPPAGEPNPLCDGAVEAVWPVDPLGERRADVDRGAALVAAALAEDPDTGDPGGTTVAGPAGAAVEAAEVDALLAERALATTRPMPADTGQLSVSRLVEIAADPDAARRLPYRLPARPDPHALRGTAFHDWVQRFYGAERLFDLADLPGAADTAVDDTAGLEALQAEFRNSVWAQRTPVAVEVPFEMALGDTVVRGRLDAVFADPDGGVTVVDWKTGAPPAGQSAAQAAAVQLGVYRSAWAELSGLPEPLVRTAFHYVRGNITVAPEVLPTRDELIALTRAGEPSVPR
ncbi:UvrD-helicase domain-containing protein [Mycolicibacillus trivialis]